MTLLDTHAWFWLVTGDPKLLPAARRAANLASTANALYLSPLSLWEIALKQSRGKLEIDRPLRPWMQQAMKGSGIQLMPVSPEIACACAELPAEFHGDPADRIIAATARTHGLTLVTHDKKLLALAQAGFFQALAT